MRKTPGYREYLIRSACRRCPDTGTYSVPLRLNSQAISSSVAANLLVQTVRCGAGRAITIRMTIPDFFCFSSSLRRSAIFSWKLLPAYLSGWTLTSSLGRDGLSFPQTKSTKFCSTPRSEEPFFTRVSASLRAPAASCEQYIQAIFRSCLHLRAVIKLGSTPTTLPDSACSVVLITGSVSLFGNLVIMVYTILAKLEHLQLRALRAPNCCRAAWPLD